MSESEIPFRLGAVHRILVDDSANTWKLQFYDSNAAAWKDIMVYDTAAQKITRLDMDNLLLDSHMATGEITFKRFKEEHGTEAAVADTDTEIAHGLGTTPTEVTLVPKTTGVAGYVMLSAKSANSITVRANVSGVDIDYSLVA